MVKSKNNAGGAILAEATAALASQINTLLPPTPPPTPPRASALGAAEDAVDDDVSIDLCRPDADDSCPVCGVSFEDAERTPDETGTLCCVECLPNTESAESQRHVCELDG